MKIRTKQLKKFSEHAAGASSKEPSFARRNSKVPGQASELLRRGSELSRADPMFQRRGSELTRVDSMFPRRGSELTRADSMFQRRGSEFARSESMFPRRGSEYPVKSSDNQQHNLAKSQSHGAHYPADPANVAFKNEFEKGYEYVSL